MMCDHLAVRLEDDGTTVVVLCLHCGRTVESWASRSESFAESLVVFVGMLVSFVAFVAVLYLAGGNR